MIRNSNGLKALALICAVLLTTFSQAFMPRHAFLERPVSNVSELVEQVSTNHSVLDHYERHFAMSEKEVIGYFKTFSVGRLSGVKTQNVYLVREDGMLDMKLETLKAGSKVFIDRSGKPILLMVCGNPLIGPKVPKVALDSPVSNSPTADIASIPVAAVTEASTELAEAVAPMEATPIEEIITVPTVPTDTAAQAILDVVPGANLNSLFGFLPLLGLGIHGGGNTPNGPNPPPTPEPASILVLGVAVAGFLARKHTR